MISAVNKLHVYRSFIVALIGIKFCMYADTNVTIPGAKFPKHWFNNRYKIEKKNDLHIILRRSVVLVINIGHVLAQIPSLTSLGLGSKNGA